MGSALEGQMLVAMPSITDPRFARSVIYMCSHSEQGAMGLILTKLSDVISLPELLQQLDIIKSDAMSGLAPALMGSPVFLGGPVDRNRGFVLHSADYFSNATTSRVGNDVCLTASLDVLRALVEGTGPAHFTVALGYAGWSAGQLDTEIQQNDWLHCSADDELLYGLDAGLKYAHAMDRIGIDPAMLSLKAGHA